MVQNAKFDLFMEPIFSTFEFKTEEEVQDPYYTSLIAFVGALTVEQTNDVYCVGISTHDQTMLVVKRAGDLDRPGFDKYTLIENEQEEMVVQRHFDAIFVDIIKRLDSGELDTKALPPYVKFDQQGFRFEIQTPEPASLN